MPLKEQPSLPGDSQTSGPSLGGRVEEIVERNRCSGRFQRVYNFHDRELTLEEYTDLVATYYAQSHHFVSRLYQGEPEAWEQLGHRLLRVAYNMFLQRGWDSQQAHERAQEAAQEACLSIYSRVYPYDCPFDGWVFLILRHHCFRSHHRPRNPLDLPGVIDPLESSLGSMADLEDVAEIEQNEALLSALGNLRSTAQRQVIECLYFQQLSRAETAEKLGKTVQAVYNLKGRALANLRALLQENEPE